ncbi:MAG: zinc-dependent alcohol dehydrogenase family protein [Bacillota bacterium]
MKAAIFYGKGDIKVVDVPVKEPAPDEAVMKVAFCGICGTDLHIFHGDEGSAATTPPCILGHEMSGTIVKVGENVTTLKPGDKVTVDPNTYCGKCYYCKSGKEHFCNGMIGAGTTIDGGFAEYCTLPEKMFIKVPDSVSYEEAAFAEPISCCLHGVDLTDIQVGDRVLVIGGGTIGLIMVQLSRLAGASSVTLIEPDTGKAALGLRLGADLCFASCDEYIRSIETEGDRVDRVIECVGKEETVSCAIEAASKGATVMIFSLTKPKAEVSIRPFEIFRKELHITASFVNPYTQARAVELLASKRVQVKDLVSMKIPLEKLAEVLSDGKYRAKTKILVECSHS